jgi:hypothetical protein
MKKLLFLLFTLSFVACDDEEKTEDLTQTVNKEGAIETQLSVEHLDNQYDIMIVTSKIWVKNDLFKTIVQRDTVPALGETDTDDGAGNVVKAKRDYEFYITVK